jgi:hypothetical protein
VLIVNIFSAHKAAALDPADFPGLAADPVPEPVDVALLLDVIFMSNLEIWVLTEFQNWQAV